MNKRDWQRAKKRLSDAEKAKGEVSIERLLKSQFKQKTDRTLYFREYFRDRAAAELPKDKKCPLCRRTFLERKQWREYNGELICSYCKAFMTRSRSHIRYYVDRNQLMNAIGDLPYLRMGTLANRFGISKVLLDDLFTGNRIYILRSTYKKMRHGYPGFKFGKKFEKHAPPFMKYLRESAGWTQNRCAEFLGLEDYAQIEYGNKACSIGKLDPLIKELVRDSGLVQYLSPSEDY